MTLGKKIKAGIYILIPIILLVLPVDFFDEGNSICLSVFLFDFECYACGLTRAVMHLIHLDFYNAWLYNKLIVIVFPLMSLLWIKYFLECFNIKILKKI